jgi:RNA recognition motif-containing protein
MSVRLYVGNLPKELERKELEELFATELGENGSTKLVTDRKTGKCRGFGFVTVETDAQADQMIEKFNGQLFKDSALKIEKAMPRAKGEGEEGGSEAVSAGGNRRSSGKGNNNKSRRNNGSSFSSQDDRQDFQPDPRWANELEKLKQMLAAQAASS